ncbi:hypothetical protein ACS12V_005712, partial [Escherichia coli]
RYTSTSQKIVAILEKIAGWRHFHPETEIVILITNWQHKNRAFYREKTGHFARLRKNSGAKPKRKCA